jgi:hypothetical protein
MIFNLKASGQANEAPDLHHKTNPVFYILVSIKIYMNEL